jgi:hypothetical protein
MTSLRQIESNRRNAQKSTGPKTESGKQRASQNAVRHGLTAETVIKLIEDPNDYHAFEMAVTADFDPDSAVERELVLQLASLLWRLRRATSIETGLFQIQSEVAPDFTQPPGAGAPEDCQVIAIFNSTMPGSPYKSGNEAERNEESWPAATAPDRLELALRFMRLADLDNGAFERLGRYEAALWRQARQTIFTLEALRWRAPSARSWRTQDRWHRAAGRSSDPR